MTTHFCFVLFCVALAVLELIHSIDQATTHFLQEFIYLVKTHEFLEFH